MSDAPNDSEADERNSAGPSSVSRSSRCGVALILLSGALWFSLFAIPFLPLTVGQKAAIAGADFVAVQIAWWVGAALSGPNRYEADVAFPQRKIALRLTLTDWLECAIGKAHPAQT